MNEEIKNEPKQNNEIDELGKLKEEIVKKSELSKKEPRKLAWNNAIITAVLVILVAISIIQSFESKAILEKIESGNLKSNSSSTPLPSSIDNLPNMVGGC